MIGQRSLLRLDGSQMYEQIVRTQKIHLQETPPTCMNPEQMGARAGPADDSELSQLL